MFHRSLTLVCTFARFSSFWGDRTRRPFTSIKLVLPFGLWYLGVPTFLTSSFLVLGFWVHIAAAGRRRAVLARDDVRRRGALQAHCTGGFGHFPLGGYSGGGYSASCCTRRSFKPAFDWSLRWGHQFSAGGALHLCVSVRTEVCTGFQIICTAGYTAHHTFHGYTLASRGTTPGTVSY